jgi:S-DNA-T family DNA segregation ATPase FtsK/SpoIIIE
VSFAFRPDPGRTLALIGEGREAAMGTLAAAVWSLAEQGLNAEFILVDALNAGGIPTPELAALATLARSLGHTVTEYAGRECGQALVGAAGKIAERSGDPSAPNCYVVAPGLHRLSGLDDFTAAGVSPGEALRRIVAEGPLARIYLLGWWSTLGLMVQQLRFAESALVSGYVFLRAPESDVQQVVGAGTRYTADPHRALFWDRAVGGPPQTMVPFGVPGAADLQALAARR